MTFFQKETNLLHASSWDSWMTNLSGNYFLVFVDDDGVCRHMVTTYLNELNLVSEKRNHSLDNNDIRLDPHKNCNEEISKTTTNSTNERANRVRLL